MWSFLRPQTGIGDTGRHRPLKAAARGVRGRSVLLKTGPPLLAGRAVAGTEAIGRARGETGTCRIGPAGRFKRGRAEARLSTVRLAWSRGTVRPAGFCGPRPSACRAYPSQRPPIDGHSWAVTPRGASVHVPVAADSTLATCLARTCGGGTQRGCPLASCSGADLVGGRCRAAARVLTEFDPHPAPTPPNMTVSISETRLIYQTRTRTREAGRSVEVSLYTPPLASRPGMSPGARSITGRCLSTGMGWVAPVNGVTLGHPFVGIPLELTQRSIMRRE